MKKNKTKLIVTDCWDTIIEYHEPYSNFIVTEFYNRYVTENCKKKVSFDQVNKYYHDFLSMYFKNHELEGRIENIFYNLVLRFNLKLNTKKNLQTICLELGKLYTPKKIDKVEELVKTAHEHGIKVCVLSNTIHSYEMTYHNITKCYDNKFIFDKLIVSSDVLCKKPNPVFFKLPVGFFNVKDEQAIYVGDNFIADVYGSYKSNYGKSFYFNWKKVNQDPYGGKLEDGIEEEIKNSDRFMEITSYQTIIDMLNNGEL